jgi:hypothetical protein
MILWIAKDLVDRRRLGGFDALRAGDFFVKNDF